jgi:hypothetical protein
MARPGVDIDFESFDKGRAAAQALLETVKAIEKAAKRAGESFDDKILTSAREVAKAFDKVEKGLKQAGSYDLTKKQAEQLLDTLRSQYRTLSEQRILLEDQAQATGDAYQIEKDYLGLLKDRLRVGLQTGTLTRDQIDNLKDQIDLQKEVTQEAKQTAEGYADAADHIQDQVNALDEADKNLTQYNKNLTKATMTVKGLSSAFTAMSKIPIFGSFVNAQQAQQSMQALAQKTNGAASASQLLGAGFSGAFSGFKANLIVLAIESLVKVIKFFIDAMFQASKQVADLRRNLDLSTEAARRQRDLAYQLADQYHIVTEEGRKQYLLQKEIIESLVETNKLFGTQYTLSEELNTGFDKLVAQSAMLKSYLKLSDEELNSLRENTVRQGGELQDNVEILTGMVKIEAASLKTNINTRQALEATLKVNGEIRNALKDNNNEIAKGVVQLRQFGMTFEDVAGIAKSLLDFETSITNELQAEVLLGRNLNLERARYLALTRDYVGLGKEINAQGITYDSISKMNAITLERTAAALGLQSDKLIEITLKQKTLNALNDLASRNRLNLTKEEKESELLVLRALNEQGVARKDLAEQIGEQALANLEAQDASERFAKAMEKVKDQFAALVDGGFIDRLVDAIESFAVLIGGSEARERAKERALERSTMAVQKARAQGGNISEGVGGQLIVTGNVSPKIQEEYLKGRVDYYAARDRLTIGETLDPFTTRDPNNAKARIPLEAALKRLENQQATVNLDSQKVGTIAYTNVRKTNAGSVYYGSA